jgi:TRAP transporter 4TM/12TM fusion protein
VNDTPLQLDPLAHAPMTERAARQLSRWWRWIAAGGLVLLSGFHLYTGTFGALTAMVQRSTHLAIALGLAFVLFPVTSKAKGKWLFVIDIALAIAGIAVVAYVGILHEQLAQRSGAATTTDLIVAGVGLLLILEGTRRSVSPALTIVTLAFLAYALFGNYLSGTLGHSRLSMNQILEHQYFTADGVFGIPLRVSSTFVFLFVLFGAFLEKSGAGQYLIDMAFGVMGRYRGGPAKAAVAASGLMGTISGSSIANTVSTGSMTIPLMKKAGFRPHVAGAVEVAASTNGQLMPPVMGAAAFIMAEYTEIPYSTIVVAALLPALLSYTAIFTMIHLEAVRHDIKPADPGSYPPLMRTLVRGIHLNIPLIAVILLLIAMRRTPDTSATWGIWVSIVLFALVALLFPLKSYGMETLTRGGFKPRTQHFAVRMLMAMRDGAMNMVGIACACACCGIIIGVVNQTGMGLKIAGLIETVSGGHLLPALLLTMVTCILLGIGLPTTATYIIMATLAVNAILNIVEPDTIEHSQTMVLAAHLFVFYYGIMADDTPPVGLCAYAAAGIAGSDPIRTGLTSFRFDLAAFTLPLIFFMNPELLLQDVDWLHMVWLIPAAILGMMCFAAVLQGYIWDKINWLERGVLLVVSFLLVKPDALPSIAGLALLIAMLALHAWLGRRRKARLQS